MAMVQRMVVVVVVMMIKAMVIISVSRSFEVLFSRGGDNAENADCGVE